MTVIAALLAAGYLPLTIIFLRHLRDRDALTRTEHAAIRGQHANDTRLFLEAIERERDAKRDEIQTLCQRIQAPEAAVIEHLERHTDPQSPYPLSESEQAEAQDKALAVIAEIERLENEDVLSLGLRK